MSTHPHFSFEFFPPKTPLGAEKLRTVWGQLALLEPQFFSVTYGAGGSTRDGTLATIEGLCADGQVAAPHLSCIGSSEQEIAPMLDHYRQMGIKRLVCLRGDLPSGAGVARNGRLAHASDLVELVRELNGDWFHIEVAAYPEFHPQSRSARQDMLAFKRKVDAGADSAITQFFFNPDAYFRFVDDVRALGVTIPIVPGIMPITNYMQLKGFCEKSAIEMPRWIEERLRDFGDDAKAIAGFGVEVVARLCETLLKGGAPGLHFYTMNQSVATTAIWRALSL